MCGEISVRYVIALVFFAITLGYWAGTLTRVKIMEINKNKHNGDVIDASK